MKSLGHIAYDGYLKSSDGKSLVSGAILPPFEELSPGIQKAWESAAKAVVEELARDEAGKCERVGSEAQ